jgi:hypothetical protein
MTIDNEWQMEELEIGFKVEGINFLSVVGRVFVHVVYSIYSQLNSCLFQL